MRLLFLASAGGAAMRRSLWWTLQAMEGDERHLLAPRAEAQSVRDCEVPTERWRPAGLFNVLRAIHVLRDAVARYEPEAIHAFGWTAAAVALGALPDAQAARTIVTLQDPIRKRELPKAFIEKRLPVLLARAARVECAYETLRRVLVDHLGVPAAKVAVVPYAIEPAVEGVRRPVGRPGPLVGFAGRLESDRAWEVAIDALAALRSQYPAAQLVFGRSGPVLGLVRAHARTAGIASAVEFLDAVSMAEFFGRIDLLVVPGTYDGLPYAVPEALVAGVPVIGADAGGIADTLAPHAAWLVPDTARGFAAGIGEAWSEIDAAWDAAAEQRASIAAQCAPERRRAQLRAAYERSAASEGAARG